MWLLNNLRIGFKLPLLTVLTGVLALILAERIGSRAAQESAIFAGQERLLSVADGRAAEIQQLLDSIVADVRAKANNPLALEAVRAFLASWRHYGPDAARDMRRIYLEENPNASDARDRLVDGGDPSLYSRVHRRFHPYFSEHRHALGYADFYLISAEGNVVYSTMKREAFARNIAEGWPEASPLGQAYRAASAGRFAVTGFGEGGFSPLGPSAIVAQPVRDDNGAVAAVFAVRVPAARLSRIVERRSGLGGTGQAFLIGPDRMVPTRMADPGAALLTRSDGAPLPAVTEALAGRRGVMRATASAGGGVLTAYAPVDFAGTFYGVLAQQSEAEILVPAVILRRGMIGEGMVALSLVSVLGLIFSRSMSVPLARVGAAMRRVARRDYSGEIPERKRRDEIGEIARQLDLFRASLLGAEGLARETAFKGAAFQGTSSALMLTDADLNIIHVNERLVALMQRHRIAIGRLVADFRPDALPGRVLTAFFPGAERARAALAEHGHVVEELRVGQAYLRVDIGPVKDREDRVMGYVVEWTDVTTERLNEVVLATIDDQHPVAGFSPDGRLIQSNALFRDWVDTRSAELNGIGWDRLFGVATPDGACAWAALSQDPPDCRALTLRAAGGRRTTLPVTLSRVTDRAGRPQRYVLVGAASAARPAGPARRGGVPLEVAR